MKLKTKAQICYFFCFFSHSFSEEFALCYRCCCFTSHSMLELST
ncbi:hypothetical protein EVA_07962 [gut metagenome]|uniref:Uncharacterized protein n=1 Tax=gut metagenome TaxID=749906 RepID=J9GAQ8_9ZZZZ